MRPTGEGFPSIVVVSQYISARHAVLEHTELLTEVLDVLPQLL